MSGIRKARNNLYRWWISLPETRFMGSSQRCRPYLEPWNGLFLVRVRPSESSALVGRSYAALLAPDKPGQDGQPRESG